MIDNVLKFISSEVNNYVIRKTDATLDPSITQWVVPGNITKLQDTDSGGANDLKGKAVLSLVNIEEDRISKPPNNYSRKNDLIEYKNPRIYLNLYCLFAVSNKDYEKGLEQLSHIIRFFQYKNVITHKNSPSINPKLDPKIDKLFFDLITLNFEQLNHLWGILGGKYLPSVLYKIRLITIEDDTPVLQTKPILKIKINDSSLIN